MAVASSPLDICNLALDHLNQDPINSITDPVSKTEKLLSRWYDNVRKRVLRMHTWNFAIKTLTISPNALGDPLDWTHEYVLPSDYIRLVSIGDKLMPTKHYDVQAGRLLINAEGPLRFRYVFDNQNVEQYDPLFVEYFAGELALAVSFALSANLGLKNNIAEMLRELRQSAFSVDGQERPPRRRETSRFKRARTRGLRFRADLYNTEDF